MSLLIQGASRGIGKALVEAAVNRNLGLKVIATSRSPIKTVAEENIQLDVTSEESIGVAAEKLKSLPPIRHLINVAGIINHPPEKTIKAASGDAMLDLVRTNAVGLALIAKHLLPLFDRTGPRTFTNLSARIGSLTENTVGGWHAYRVSKAAANMVMRGVAAEMQPRGISCFSIYPGHVSTDMTREYQKALDPKLVITPEEAAERILDLILSEDGLKFAGRFVTTDGVDIPW